GYPDGMPGLPLCDPKASAGGSALALAQHADNKLIRPEGCQNLCSAPNPSFDTLQERTSSRLAGVLAPFSGYWYSRAREPVRRNPTSQATSEQAQRRRTAPICRNSHNAATPVEPGIRVRSEE